MKNQPKLRLITALLFGTALSLVLGAPALFAAGGMYMLSGLNTEQAHTVAGSLFDITINSSTIIQEAQTYFRPGGQSVSNIQRSLLDKRDYPMIATKRIVEGDIVELDQAEITDVIQTFKTQFSPKGTVTMTPVPFRLRNIKIDVQLNPDKIKSTYYGFLAGLNEEDRSKWPIVRYIWEVLMAEKWGANQALCDWAGEYVAPTNDTTAGPTLGSYDGLKKIVTDGLSAGTMNELNLDFDPTQASETFQAFEQIVDLLPQELQDEELVFLCSKKTELAYFRDRRNTHGSDTDYMLKNNVKQMTLDGRPNMVIQPMNGIGRNGDHGWIVVTPKRNLLIGERAGGYNMGMEKALRSVAILADWYEGVGVGLAEEVFVHRPTDAS